MEFARTGPYAYVSCLDTISVLDLTDPRAPVLRGQLVQALFENESMTYGERVVDGELARFVIAGVDLFRVASDDLEHVNVDDGAQMAIIDVTDPDNPFTRVGDPARREPGTVTSSTHTVQCLDQADCRYAYTAGGRDGFFSVLDLTDLDAPKEVATVNSPAAGPNPVFTSGAGHYWDFDTAGIGWHTGSGGAAAFDVPTRCGRAAQRHERAGHRAGPQRLHPAQLDAPQREGLPARRRALAGQRQRAAGDRGGLRQRR